MTYQRKDGVKLSATLYLPPGYKQGDRLPVIMWAYPREFGDPDSASQITGSPNRFTIVTGYSHLFLLLSGYAFQSERRTFWEVPDLYAKMSPFWYAHEVKDPILLMHGEADDNSGTFPIQSERFYMALKGQGATVRYVTLPFEAHGCAGRETLLHILAERINWFDKYLKNAPPRMKQQTAAN